MEQTMPTEKTTVTTKSTTEEPAPPPRPASAAPPMLVVDIRKKHSKKQIRKLRKGQGKLAAKVQDMVSDFHEDGALMGKGSDPAVVVVVRQKRKRNRNNPFGL